MSVSYFKRAICLLPLVFGAIACTPRADNAPTSTPVPTPLVIQPAALPTDAAGVPVVARVNDVEITLPDFERMMARYKKEPFVDPDGIPRIVLTTMIQQVLINQAAQQNSVTVSADEVDQEVQGLITYAGGQEAWQRWLQDNGYTEDELRATLYDTLVTNRMRDRVTGDLSGAVPQAHARHILVATQEEAQQLLVRIQNGEDFAALAARYSLDVSTSGTGGDLGWFTQEELLEPELSKVAFALQPGQIAGPVQSSLGFHILQTIELANREVEPEKRAQLAQNRFESWLNSLTAAATIEEYL